MCSSWHPQQCIVGIVKVESRPNQDAPPVAAFQRQRCPPVPEGLRDELAGLLSVAHGNSETSAQTLSRPLITFCSLSSLLNCWNNESRITADIKGKLSTTFSVFFFLYFKSIRLLWMNIPFVFHLMRDVDSLAFVLPMLSIIPLS